MKTFLYQDRSSVGVLLALGSIALVAVVVGVVLALVGLPLLENVRWFGLAFIVPILWLRHYVKKGGFPHVVKAMIVCLFVTFIAFMWLFLSQPGGIS